MSFALHLINGLQMGSIYALVALGYTMVYGIIKLLNFAHGDIIMVGGYIALFSLTLGRMPALLAALVTVAGCTLLAVIIEKLAYTPLRFAPRLSLLITAIGISILLQNLAQFFFTANDRGFPGHLLFPTGSVSIGGLSIAYTSIITVALSIASMAALHLLVKSTKLGKAMRAVSEDQGAAQLMGINVNHIITFTFAVGAALAGVGALLYSVRFPLIAPTIGAMLGLKAFVAAVFGGIGSIPGTMVGGYAIGLLEALVTAAGLSGWVDGVVFLLLIIVLMVRPTGLMGRPIMEKV
ncbi:MAG: branched-chain amino acid ABC transporter permease [Oscillospiraceae bacterium]|nr:branched-chain amino acid ABC transporter permease [Oscillospiraceae bacterium]